MDDGPKNVPTDSSTDNTNDPLVLYARSLHHHTLSQWADTRRIAEERRKEQQKLASDGQQPQKVAASMPNQPQGEAEGKTKESNSTQPAQPSDD